MKKLITAITALMVLGITNQVFAHGDHEEDSVLVGVRFSNMDPGAGGNLYQILMPDSQYYHEDGYSMSYMTGAGHQTHFAGPCCPNNFSNSSSPTHMIIESNRDTNWQIISRDGNRYTFAVDGDGNVTPADALWVTTLNHPNFAVYGEITTKLRVELSTLGSAYSDKSGTVTGWRNEGGGAPGADGDTGADGAAGAQGPQGKQGDAGSAGATGAAGDQGPQGKVGAAGADAPCTPCADVTDAAVALACEILGGSPPASVSELQASSQVIVDSLLISANICDPDNCDISAGIQTAIDTKLGE